MPGFLSLTRIIRNLHDSHNEFAPNKKLAARNIKDLSELFGPAVVEVVLRIVRHELQNLERNPVIKKPLKTLTTTDCHSLSLDFFYKLF